MTSSEFWQKTKAALKLQDDESFAGELGFEARGFAGTEKIAALLAEKKRAAFSTYAVYAIDNEILPVSGEFYIVKNAEEEAVCAIQIQRVEILPFNEVPWSLAALEGEDENLQEWRERTREILEEESEIIGYEFREDIKLVFMEFKIVMR
ncbi:MAG: ASCH domain-containing protein [Treponema sp.]|nr:ASCH domain-containing protein [Treponema sp.]